VKQQLQQLPQSPPLLLLTFTDPQQRSPYAQTFGNVHTAAMLIVKDFNNVYISNILSYTVQQYTKHCTEHIDIYLHCQSTAAVTHAQ
jgi:hypothetical protein